MKISIIGSGNIGRVLTEKLVKSGHQVYISNSRGPESLATFSKETGAIPVTVQEAVSMAEVIIISIPQHKITALPQDLFKDIRENVVVMETGNYFPTISGVIEGLEAALTESEWVQKCIGKRVNKVFNSISMQSLRDLGKPKGDKNRIAIPVSGDHQESKAIVMQLVDELGFDPFDQGMLSDSWRQQPGTSVFCTDLKLAGLSASIEEMGDHWTPEIHKSNALARDTQMEAYLKRL